MKRNLRAVVICPVAGVGARPMELKMKNNLTDILKEHHVARIIKAALAEDLSEQGDTTTKALVPADVVVKASIISRGSYIVSGTTVAKEVFRDQDKNLKCEILIPDGERAEADETVMSIEGKAQAILTAERTALNFMQRMTGIATQTSVFVAIAEPYGVKILDTRKTTPGLRLIEKYAVLCGGGTNHRKGLYDMVMIKDNHRNIWSIEHELALDLAVNRARECYPDIPVEVEVESEEELRSALKGSPDWILLDNMPPEEMSRCVAICAGKSKLEASGGITLTNIEECAKSGVDAISLGCLTHSVTSADLSLEIV